MPIKVRGSSRTIRTLVNSKILSKSSLTIISILDNEMRLTDIEKRTGMTYSSILRDINYMEKIGLVYSKRDTKFRYIVPSENLVEIRQLIIALIRKIEGVEFEDFI